MVTARTPDVALVSPTYFAPESVIGGGERYVEELAKSLADRMEVRLISFGRTAFRERPAHGLERVVLRSWTRDPMTPFSPRLGRELRGIPVVHAFQYHTLSTFLACWLGHRQGSRVFVTDLGGGGWTPAYHVDQSRWIDGYLPISRYAARGLPGRTLPCTVLYGGVDIVKFAMRSPVEHDGSVVFLGRLLPHKGIHFLIEGLPEDVPLHVIGPGGDAEYVDRLHRLAAGKQVHFHHGLRDDEVIAYLQRAMALVHPTPVDEHGSAGAAELFGLAVVEAMACGCPVIASRAASLPEIVDDGVTGYLVTPNDPAGITRAIRDLISSPGKWASLSVAARLRVESSFSWAATSRTAAACYSGHWPPRAVA